MRRGVFVAVCLLAAAAAGAQPGATTRGRELRSLIVYPEQRITVRMDHSHPAHTALRCVRCHVDAGRSRRAADVLLPREAACAPCHDEETSREQSPTAERCGTCHVGFVPDRAVVPSELPTARLSFSHALHVRRGMRCLECHEGVPQSRVATRSHLPTMRSCFRCHGGREERASGDCRTCHPSRPDGRLRTAWPEGRMNPPAWTGMHHDREWVVRHRWVAADRGSDCASCHTASECEDCHEGRVRPPSVHPNDFLTLHPQVARRGDQRCASCHTTATFCGECHARLGISPISAPDARATARFHPPTEVWLRGPVQHGVEARRAMSACASCHVERDCVQCHGTLGIGAGVSPHPAGFATECAEHLRRNPRACATCHGDAAALRVRCR